MPAAAPYFFINRWSVVRSIGRFCFDRKIGPGEAAAHFQPGAERPSFLAHQMVMAGIGTLEPVDKHPVGFKQRVLKRHLTYRQWVYTACSRGMKNLLTMSHDPNEAGVQA